MADCIHWTGGWKTQVIIPCSDIYVYIATVMTCVSVRYYGGNFYRLCPSGILPWLPNNFSLACLHT